MNSNEKQNTGFPNDDNRAISRRGFLGAFGAAAVTSAFIAGTPAGADDDPVWYYDSWGAVVPANPAALAVGVYPPPLPSGVEPPGQLDSALHRRSKRPVARLEDEVVADYTQPNILMVIVDQMRQEKWFPSGSPGGPSAIFNSTNLKNITNLRNSSFVFGYHFTAATNCSPARAALLTGLYSQQTCTFKGVNASGGPPLQTGFPTIGSVLSAVGYNCTWIGKWHLSAYAGASSGSTGANGPSDYGFSAVNTAAKPLSIPNLYSTSSPYPTGNTYASPDGGVNEGAGGTDLSNAQIASGYRSASPQTFTPTSVEQLRDGAIADAFVNYFMASPPSSPWFTAVSFVNPHDLSYFPYAYGLTSGDFGPPSAPPTAGYDAPPTGGNDTANPAANDYIPALSGLSPYGTSAPLDFYLVPWNYYNGSAVDDPLNLEYGTLQPSGQYGKPGLQAYQESQLNEVGGSVLDEAGWIIFLNYYYWMQTAVDAQIGRVINSLKANSTLWGNTTIIFTADHGEYGGSHNLHAKGAGLYDEAINVPLFISFPSQRTGTYGSGSPVFVYDFLSSSVDILPYLYTSALGSEEWRSNPDSRLYYLRNRESFADAIYETRYSEGITQHRETTVNGNVVPYILHTTDEDSSAVIPGTATAQPSHAIAFRTADFSTTPAGGGKLGMYNFWPVPGDSCSSGQSATEPINTTESQFEFYDYSNGSPPNYGEVGNQALYDDGGVAALTTTAMGYKRAFDLIAAAELYYPFSEVYSAYVPAYDAYLSYAGFSSWCYTPAEGGS